MAPTALTTSVDFIKHPTGRLRTAWRCVCVPVLGSRSADVMSAINAATGRDVLPVENTPTTRPRSSTRGTGGRHEEHLVELRVVPSAARRLAGGPGRAAYHLASNRSDRVGMRLRQHRWPDRQLPRRRRYPPGAAQRTVIRGRSPDHRKLSGRRLITDEDIDSVAQIRPGQYVRTALGTTPVSVAWPGVTQAR